MHVGNRIQNHFSTQNWPYMAKDQHPVDIEQHPQNSEDPGKSKDIINITTSKDSNEQNILLPIRKVNL